MHSPGPGDHLRRGAARSSRRAGPGNRRGNLPWRQHGRQVRCLPPGCRPGAGRRGGPVGRRRRRPGRPAEWPRRPARPAGRRSDRATCGWDRSGHAGHPAKLRRHRCDGRLPAGPERRGRAEPLRADGQFEVRDIQQGRHAAVRPGKHQYPLVGIRRRLRNRERGRPHRPLRPVCRPLAADPVHRRRADLLQLHRPVPQAGIRPGRTTAGHTATAPTSPTTRSSPYGAMPTT